ncbi:dicarboxylate/amino acid:cation symporter [Paenibacillus sp. 481]|uniref:dicarboxylate/amino acid:cation symporter n=1 Tax=Paenibacillus sp. 481 TaxID=2835869 RepID=UPI001E59891D|nr:dicarboxylate/amino acid:cation symporter [Paenibacillus sp. 481]UHA73737.1 dicarboxylate/amino acid:cation symporter [Paenibacillus sp. 481]
MKRIGLFMRIVIAIALGIGLGLITPDWFVRIFATFNNVFGEFLSFIIPLIIVGFIIPGIGELGRGAGKLVGLTAGIVYASTIIAGFLAYAVAYFTFPMFLSATASGHAAQNPGQKLLESYFEIGMPPVFDIMTALLLAFMIGIGITVVQADGLMKVSLELKDIVSKVISTIIVPLLPIHIAGIFMNMTQAGEVAMILQVFIKVFAIILVLHFVILVLQYSVAGALNKRNPFSMLRMMLPAYFTALGTQSSAATIPVTLKQVKQLGTDEEVADFVVPLCATIHITGSTITLTSVSAAILLLNGQVLSLEVMLPFILMLGITMIAAPSVPGGGVMAALGLFTSMLGFDEAMVSLAIALYIAQDSFGTATNVTGDGAIAQIIHYFKKKSKVTAKHKAAS